MKLVGANDSIRPVYEYRVSFYEKNIYRVYIIDGLIVFHSSGKEFKGEKIVNQVEFPLAALDLFLATIARYELPLDAGGLGGLHHMKPAIVEGEEVYFDKQIHPKFGVPFYTLRNSSRRSYIDSDIDQRFSLYEETMDSGLFAKLIEINNQYKAGTLNEWLAKT